MNGGYPPPPQAQNPYNSNVPPMAVAEGGGSNTNANGADGGSKVGEAGKKFGKKLGNAAIFGAGATLGDPNHHKPLYHLPYNSTFHEPIFYQFPNVMSKAFQLGRVDLVSLAQSAHKGVEIQLLKRTRALLYNTPERRGPAPGITNRPVQRERQEGLFRDINIATLVILVVSTPLLQACLKPSPFPLISFALVCLQLLHHFIASSTGYLSDSRTHARPFSLADE
ncbi:hypothetical protein NUW58_g6442 [Xylaria curta]|uniref:Uncharacterized protein n=1 Tax=Xylaria curta TaxID=42375 RepID=A0ACC1NTG6_9PEZI|nr:hypothetical protein NUW58_g6442 [Xylaria curta]